MALLMRQARGMLNGLGDLQSRLVGALIAAKQGGMPDGSYQRLKSAVHLLITAEDDLPSNPDAARARFVDAQRIFKSEEQTCVSTNAIYCSRIGVETFASIFREESARILSGINNPSVPTPPSKWDVLPPRRVEWGWENYVLLGFGLLGGYVFLRGMFKGAKAIGAGATAGVRTAREVIRS